MTSNPYVNKVEYGNQTLIDLSADTVARNDVYAGKTFHLPTGELTTGTLGSETYSWLGLHVTKVDDFYNNSWTLDQTAFATWTPSTTAKTIVAAANIDTFVADLANYEYWLCWKFDYIPAFVTGATMVAQTERYASSVWQCLHRRPSNLANISTNTDSGFCCTTYIADSYIIYYNTNGTRTFNTGISYGVYVAGTAATVPSGSSGSLTPTVTRKTQAISTRCSTSYFDVARAPEVDQSHTTLKLQGSMYRVDAGTSNIRQFFKQSINILNNPL